MTDMFTLKSARRMAISPALILFFSACSLAHGQAQDKLSYVVESDLRSFIMYSDSTYSHSVSSLALMSLSSAMENARTEEDFRALLVATRILYCHKVLEDLTYSTPNYSQVKSNFESELKNDLISLKHALE